jgi:hypothetical protein
MQFQHCRRKGEDVMKKRINSARYTTNRPGAFCLMAIAAFTLNCVLPALAEEVIQIDVKSILNTRSITTLTNGKLVPWIKGVDGSGVGSYDGYMTSAASLFNGDKNVKALPDSAVFPAHGILPRVVLNYSNDDSVGFQTHYVTGIDSFAFNVPQNKYSKIFIFLTSSEKPSNVSVTLTYTNGVVSSDYVVPDYAGGPLNDQNFCSLVTDLAKWLQNNKVNESAGHRIDALNVHSDSAKTLKSIKVSKTFAPSYLVFWGATGVAPSPSPVKYRPAAITDGLGLFGQTHISCAGQGLRFINLPANTEIGVYSVTGRLVGHLNTANTGTYDWNPVSKVSTGVYICVLRSGKAERNISVLKGEKVSS